MQLMWEGSKGQKSVNALIICDHLGNPQVTSIIQPK